MLKIKLVRKEFHNKDVLNNVSLTVDHNEIAILLGASGVGKSTLLRVLNNLESADEGTVELDGKVLDLATINKTHAIGMVFQQFNLFEHLTVEENITLALEKIAGKTKPQAQKIAQENLEHFHMLDKKDKYPAQLSGGQKQRVALMRALALNPKVICFDEPSSALDPRLTGQLIQTMSKLAEGGHIVLIATHDTTLLDKLAKTQVKVTIYFMQDGRIVDVAPIDERNDLDKHPKLASFIAGITGD